MCHYCIVLGFSGLMNPSSKFLKHDWKLVLMEVFVTSRIGGSSTSAVRSLKNGVEDFDKHLRVHEGRVDKYLSILVGTPKKWVCGGRLIPVRVSCSALLAYKATPLFHVKWSSTYPSSSKYRHLLSSESKWSSPSLPQSFLSQVLPWPVFSPASLAPRLADSGILLFPALAVLLPTTQAM